MFGSAPSNAKPPPVVRHILRRLNLSLSPVGAKQVLENVQYKSKTASVNQGARSLTVT